MTIQELVQVLSEDVGSIGLNMAADCSDFPARESKDLNMPLDGWRYKNGGRDDRFLEGEIAVLDTTRMSVRHTAAAVRELGEASGILHEDPGARPRVGVVGIFLAEPCSPAWRGMDAPDDWAAMVPGVMAAQVVAFLWEPLEVPGPDGEPISAPVAVAFWGPPSMAGRFVEAFQQDASVVRSW